MLINIVTLITHIVISSIIETKESKYMTLIDSIVGNLMIDDKNLISKLDLSKPNEKIVQNLIKTGDLKFVIDDNNENQETK